MRPRRTALAALLLLPVLGLAPARGARPPEAVPQLAADPVAVEPGATLSLEGRGFPPNTHIALLARPAHGEAVHIGGANSGRRGRFTATIHIRRHSDAGAFVALACVDACRVKARAAFRIVVP